MMTRNESSLRKTGRLDWHDIQNEEEDTAAAASGARDVAEAYRVSHPVRCLATQGGPAEVLRRRMPAI